MIKIAGSGPSADQVGKVDVATKKRSAPSDYVFCRFSCSYKHKVYGNHGIPMMVYYSRNHCTCGDCPECNADKYVCDSDRWNKYYQKFSKKKPSTGLCAVFGVMERWQPETIGLIGFDGVLDGYPGWTHDAEAEKRCIESLTTIKDLRI